MSSRLGAPPIAVKVFEGPKKAVMFTTTSNVWDGAADINHHKFQPHELLEVEYIKDLICYSQQSLLLSNNHRHPNLAIFLSPNIYPVMACPAHHPWGLGMRMCHNLFPHMYLYMSTVHHHSSDVAVRSV